MDQKGYAFVAGLFIFLLVAAGGSYWYLTTSPTRTAFLNVEEGMVEVDQGSGWTPAKDNMDLSLGDRVRTKAGRAVIVFYESIIVVVDPDSIVALADLAKEHVRIDHDAGSAWHKFTGLTGISTFSVATPNTVATVRGTEFGTQMEQVLVGEGKVGVKTDDTEVVINALEKVGYVEGEWVTSELSPEEKALLVERFEFTIEQLKKLRMAEAMKKPLLYSSVKKLYGISDEEIPGLLDEVDAGGYDLDELEARAPVKSEVVTKLRGLTEQIIKQHSILASLQDE